MLDRVRSVNGADQTRADQTRADQTRAGQTQANPIQASERSRTTPVPPMPSNRQPPRASRTVWRPRSWLPIALGAMGVMAIAGLLLQNAQLNTRLQALETSQQSLEAVLNSSQTRLVVLNSSDTKTAVGRLLVGPDGLVQISHTMSKNASGHTWQAWYILKGESTPRPLETTNESHLMIRVPANAQVIAVSEEPVGGSLVPTMVRAIATL
jgi:hypothetical protein